VVHQRHDVRSPRTPVEVGRKQAAGLVLSRGVRRLSHRRRRWLASVLASCFVLMAMGSCAPLVRYTNELVDDRHGRTWFTRLPSALGGTFGFALGVPIDVVSLPVTFVVYRSQPRETRDPLSVFLFPSFALWKVGALVGAPFDVVEWAAYRSWQDPAPVTPEEREAIERRWDALEFTEYPVTPIYPR